jgi:hypothetical protein
MNPWMKWWYPGLRWTPETLSAAESQRKARERSAERELLISRLVLVQLERVGKAVEDLEQRVRALEAWEAEERRESFWEK